MLRSLVSRVLPLLTISVISLGAQQTNLNTPWQSAGPLQVSTAAYGKVTGRVTAIAIDPADTTGNTVYLGTTGGVWKSTNANGPAAAVQFTPMTDTLQAYSANAGSSATASLSIGSITVQPGGTGVLLAGTGDPNEAADSYAGSGILRSTDKGVTWTLLQQSNDGAAGNHSFVGESFAGFAWSTTTANLAVAAVSSSARGSVTGASTLGKSVRGLYYSTDAGSTWKMATIQDGTQTVQGASSDFSGYEGNAVTSVAWNPLRKRFYAAVRYHGYYESADGRTFTRLAAQPGTGLTAAACPARAGTTGLTTCPIFRGTVAAQPASGDLFALTVDAANGDTGLYQDTCISTGTACASATVLWAKKLVSTPLENGSGAIPQGSYTLALAALPAASGNDTLLFAGTQEIFRCRTSDTNGCSLRNTTNATTANCAAPAMVAPAQHAIAVQTNVAGGTVPLLLFGNDGGLWRSTDGVDQQLASCSSDDATHFDNLNGALGTLAEVSAFSAHPSDGGIGIVALGTLGSAASTTSSTSASLQDVWTQLGTGYSGSVLINQAVPANWFLQSGSGVSLFACGKGTGCASADFSGTASIASSQVNGDLALASAPALLDPALSSNAVVGTCRVYRGPASGGWTASNAIGAPLTGPANSTCTGANGLVRSIAAGGTAVLTGAVQTSGSPVIYAGLARTATVGGAYGGRIFRNTAANLATASTQWTDVTEGTVTNDTANSGRFNPLGYDVSSLATDPNDSTGFTVYAAIQGIGGPLVYRSVNGASAWTNITANLPRAPANAVLVDPSNGKVVYVALDTGVYVTTDVTACAAANAQCWSLYGTGLPNAPVTTLSASTGFAVPGSSARGVLRAGTYGRGLWQLPLVSAGQASVAAATLSPASLTFASQPISYASAAQTVTVTNTGSVPLAVTRVSASSGWTETDNCAGNTLAVNTACSVQVSFVPSASGAATGTLNVFGNVPGGYVTAGLSGTGSSQAGVVLAPGTLTFADTSVRTTSTAATLSLTNNGGQSVTVAAPAVTGDFALASNNCPASLTVGGTCALTVTFKPTVSGPRTGVLTLADSFSTHVATLTGTGTAGEATLSTATLQFPDTAVSQSSPNRTITVTNTGNGALAIAAAMVTGDFSMVADSCSNTSLAPAASCTITLRFVPSQAGTRLGTLLLPSNSKGDPASTASVALGGSTPSSFSVVLTPAALDFGAIAVGTISAVRNISVSNAGSGSGSLGVVTVSGDYVVKANTCGATLASQTGCTVSIAFAPGASGSRTGIFLIADDAGTQTATLTGTGTLPATDTLSPLSLAFAATAVNTASPAQQVLLTNSGDAALTLISARITGGDFTVVNGCGPSLPAHSSCGIAVTFSPKSIGQLSGTLEVDDVQRAQLISLSGTAIAGPGVSLAPSVLSFGTAGVGNTTASQTVVLTNNGGSGLTLSAITVTGDFGLVPGPGGCSAGTALAVGASCSMSVVFTPTAAGPRSGALTLTAVGGVSQTALLGGTGVNFALTANGPASLTVATGQSATFPLLLTPALASNLPVTYACTGAPANAKCSITSTYTDLSATSNVVVTVSTGTTLAEVFPPRMFWFGSAVTTALLVMPGYRSRRRTSSILCIAIMMSLGLGGCGSSRHIPENGAGSGSTAAAAVTPAGTYTLVVTATASGLTRQVPLTLIVTAQ